MLVYDAPPRPFRRAVALPYHAAAALPAAAGHVRAAGPHRAYGRDGTVRQYGGRRRYSLHNADIALMCPTALACCSRLAASTIPTGGRVASPGLTISAYATCYRAIRLQILQNLVYLFLDLRRCAAAVTRCHILSQAVACTRKHVQLQLFPATSVRSLSYPHASLCRTRPRPSLQYVRHRLLLRAVPWVAIPRGVAAGAPGAHQQLHHAQPKQGAGACCRAVY